MNWELSLQQQHTSHRMVMIDVNSTSSTRLLNVMRSPLNSIKSTWLLQTIAMVFLMMQVSCTFSPTSRPENEKWTDLTILVDGFMEVQVSIPIPDQQQESQEGKASFVGSGANTFSELFVLGYDRRHGALSEAPSVRYSGAIYRDDWQDADSQISFEDFFQLIYSDKPRVKRDRRYVGMEIIGGREWYKVDYVGKRSLTASGFFHLMENNYAMMVSITVFGKNAEETLLYKQRYSDLKKLLASVKITVADFANQNEE